MSNVTVSGLPAIAWGIGFVVIGALPVWLAAKVTGAGYATLPRAALALLLGTAAAFGGMLIGGPMALVLVPLGYLLAFKLILDTSLLGAFILGLLALAGYAFMAKLLGGGISFT